MVDSLIIVGREFVGMALQKQDRGYLRSGQRVLIYVVITYAKLCPLPHELVENIYCVEKPGVSELS